jgi:hypothetical protein
MALSLPADRLHLFDADGWALERRVNITDQPLALPA